MLNDESSFPRFAIKLFGYDGKDIGSDTVAAYMFMVDDMRKAVILLKWPECHHEEIVFRNGLISSIDGSYEQNAKLVRVNKPMVGGKEKLNLVISVIVAIFQVF